MVELQLVHETQKEILYNVLQKYLYEMTKYYDDEMDDKGNYLYKYFDNYFIEPTRKAMFILFNNKLAGFILLNNSSYINHTTDNVIAEFSIFPIYRKRGIAQKAVDLLYSLYPGTWELKYNLCNIPAVNFWIKSTKKFKPVVYDLGHNEQVLSFQTTSNPEK